MKRRVETIQAKAKKLEKLKHDILNHITVMKVRHQEEKKRHREAEKWGRQMERKARRLLVELFEALDIIEKNHRKDQNEQKR